MTPNAYSPTWFEVFLRGYWPEQTAREVAFVARLAPLPAYEKLLDVCCGAGRHSLPLASLGYAVTGVDRDEGALAQARQRLDGMLDTVAPTTFLAGDMRDLSALPTAFNVCVCLWQSFGYFDAATNAEVLRQMAGRLRPGGRLLLDLYHRGYYEAHQGEREMERDGRRLTIVERMEGARLLVTIAYDGAILDRFDWELYTPNELAALANRCGLRTVLACTNWDETHPTTPEIGRMQLVFER